MVANRIPSDRRASYGVVILAKAHNAPAGWRIGEDVTSIFGFATIESALSFAKEFTKEMRAIQDADPCHIKHRYGYRITHPDRPLPVHPKGS